MAARYFIGVLAVVCLVLLGTPIRGQQPTGSIKGTIVDPSAAVIPGATIVVANRATAVEIRTESSGAGGFTVSSLLPGEYEVQVKAAGFKTSIVAVTVWVGRAASVRIQMEMGVARETVTVESSEIAVNAFETTVEGVVTENLIRDLPLNGRNFLDLGQLEPGVQIQDGGNFDPTKNQFAGLSISGSTGRTTRVTLDGLDISDETVGTTTLNISMDSVKEFQISRGSNDVSTDLTNTGAVNVITKGGTNDFHGDFFYFLRDDAGAARVGQSRGDFRREQVGFRAGGPFSRDKLFWFVNFERTLQDGSANVNLPLFTQFNGTFTVPFDEYLSTGKLDWNISPSLRTFYRFSHNDNVGVASSSLGGSSLSPFSNDNQSLQHAAGLDWATGNITTSFRFGYLNFNNEIVDARRAVPGIPLTLDPNGGEVTVLLLGDNGGIGPNILAPQQTLQDNYQYRYDGT